MEDLLREVRNLPDASVGFARGVGWVKTPGELVPLRDRVRKQHSGELRILHAAIDDRFGTTGASDDYVNVFYAASEMALMERIGRADLSPSERRTLRGLWNDLLNA